MYESANAAPLSFFADSVSSLCLLQPSAEKAPDGPCPDSAWELIFADCDMLPVTGKNHSFSLFRNELFLCAHSCSSFPATPKNSGAIVFRFSCTSPFLCLLAYLPLRTSKAERILLAQLLLQAASGKSSGADRYMEYFLDRLLTRHDLCSMNSHPNKPFSQMLCNAAELSRSPQTGEKGSAFPHLLPAELLYLSVLLYLKSHLYAHPSLDRICADHFVSRSCLEGLFQRMGWHGVMDCFSHLKMNAAKRLIESGNMTFTQISVMLGYSSIHYFSRRFKEITKTAPSEYASFVKEHPDDAAFRASVLMPRFLPRV